VIFFRRMIYLLELRSLEMLAAEILGMFETIV
jgi:hypothetical protein